MKSITVYGHINEQGKLTIYNKGQFAETLKTQFKNLSIEMIVRERFYEFSHQLRKYYFGIVVRELQKGYLSQGMLKSLDDIDTEMRERFLYYETYDEENDKWEKHIHTLRKNETKVTNKMFKEFIEKCIIFSIQSLDWAIPYPNEEFDDSDKTENQLRTEWKKIKENTF